MMLGIRVLYISERQTNKAGAQEMGENSRRRSTLKNDNSGKKSSPERRSNLRTVD
jgi:hypothetical protein